ncbi:MAG: porin family protein [Candidatus Zixiibacteriota bacterium]
MKRFLVLSVLLVAVLAITASAADSGKKMPMSAGFKAGISLANATGSDATIPGGDKKMKMGLAGGAFIGFGIAPQFVLQPELLYVQKGVKYEEKGGPGKLTEKLDYLQVPVLFKFVPNTAGKIQPTIFAGPYLGFLMSAKAKFEGDPDPANNGEEDIKDALKSTDFGISFGAGVGAKMTKGELFLDVRYDLGLSKIEKSDGGETANVKNSSILALVGYKFDI